MLDDKDQRLERRDLRDQEFDQSRCPRTAVDTKADVHVKLRASVHALDDGNTRRLDNFNEAHEPALLQRVGQPEKRSCADAQLVPGLPWRLLPTANAKDGDVNI